jgi:hypothetical protein
VGATEVINACPGRLVIHTYGMRALSAALTRLSYGDIKRVYAAAIRAAAEPIAGTARDLARRTSGEYAGSISIGGGRTGAVLRASDPAAGPIEFANAGAYASVPAHQRAGQQVSAYARPMNLPGSGGQALFPAIERHADAVAQKTGEVVAAAYQALCDLNPLVLDG